MIGKYKENSICAAFLLIIIVFKLLSLRMRGLMIPLELEISENSSYIRIQSLS